MDQNEWEAGKRKLMADIVAEYDSPSFLIEFEDCGDYEAASEEFKDSITEIVVDVLYEMQIEHRRRGFE